MHCSLAKLLLPLCLGCAVSAGLVPLQKARGQDCAGVPGSARTDCYIGRSRILGQESGIAASSARLRTSAERLRAVTGGSYDPVRRKPHKARKAKSKHQVNVH